MDKILYDDTYFDTMCDSCAKALAPEKDAMATGLAQVPQDYFVEFFRFLIAAIRAILYTESGSRRSLIGLVLMLPRIVMILKEIVRLIHKGIQGGREAKISRVHTESILYRLGR